jgi:hypothetical protein
VRALEVNHDDEYRYAGIRFTPEKVAEVDGERTVAAVPRADIRAAKVQYGFRARHPLILAALGLALLGVGGFEMVVIARWFFQGGTLHRLQVWLAVLVVLGGSALWQAFQRGFILVIDSKGGQRRLEFDNSATQSGIAAFLHEVEDSLGYEIKR